METLLNIPTLHYHQIRDHIQSGDILLCSGNGFFSNMIQRATKSPWSHVAFILRLDIIDRIMVLESVESVGVRTVVLRSYVQDYNGSGQGYDGRIALARHKKIHTAKLLNLSRTATGLLGYPYNKEEIVRIAARIGMNAVGLTETGVDPDPLTQREFICSEYAYRCFKSIGIEIAFDSLGFIAPVDFANDPNIEILSFIQSQRSTECRAPIKPDLGVKV